ncbi:hypothetical protein K435DRAFT_905898 [Dendrothele bispora CBS 962.96]|uniref:Nephrocystin 3-like N-terminal domain-containing protein n=1 Tax=Dendrothele bispora (strain CBS 962.96) TaxID=1314807 RepID=A0A4S8MNG1_DENBC|nr:hypothetical protein K435DRAFT_905898 [Dendrothele bispora CBS 962.96]
MHLDNLSAFVHQSVNAYWYQIQITWPTMSNPDSATGNTSHPFVSLLKNSQGNTIGNITVNNVKGDQYNYGSEFDIKKIREWLDAPDSSFNYANARGKSTKNTGMWLVNNARFQKWKNNGGILWLQGQAGSGKTFLCTNVITCLEKLTMVPGVGECKPNLNLTRFARRLKISAHSP